MKNRLLKYLTGLLFMGLGTVLMLKSELGVAAFDALCMGLSENIHFSTGTCCMGLGILIILINSIIEKRIPSFFSFLTSLIVGMCIDLWMKLIIYIPYTSLWRLFFLIIGMLINTFGIALYISAELSRGPIDQLMLNISNLMKTSIWIGKTCMEVFFSDNSIRIKRTDRCRNNYCYFFIRRSNSKIFRHDKRKERQELWIYYKRKKIKM